MGHMRVQITVRKTAVWNTAAPSMVSSMLFHPDGLFWHELVRWAPTQRAATPRSACVYEKTFY
eukprot:365639-Chlamydomonas_euryale.AAC.5